MAITKIGTPELFDFSSLNTALQLPTGTTAERPGTLAGTAAPVAGEWRYNTTLSYVEYYDGAAWFQIDTEAFPAVIPVGSENFNTNTYFGNGASQVIDAKFNEAANFNGTSSVITIAALTPKSISMWVNLNVLDRFDALIGHSTNTANYVYWADNAEGNVLRLGNVDFGTDTAKDTVGVVGGWVNVVLSYDGTSDTSCYINGVFKGTVARSIGEINEIGARTAGGTNQYLYGKLDQVRIYNSSLDQADVTALQLETTTTASSLSFPSGETAIATYQLDGNGDDISGTYSATSTTDIGYTGLKFEPDLVWIKDRDTAGESNRLTDSVRGVTKPIYSNGIFVQGNEPNGLTNFNSNGFTIGSNSAYNTNTKKYVAWNWRAGGAPDATNTNGAGLTPTFGSIMIDDVKSTAALLGNIAAKKISANTVSGFSIVQWEGTGTTGTVAHCLSSTPELILTKNIDVAANDGWPVFTTDTGNGKFLQLNTSSIALTSTGTWNQTDPNNTVFTVNDNEANNNINNNIIAYCFHSVTGYQKIGTYTGTGNASGEVVNTVFEPSFLMVKATDLAGTWAIYDNKRDPSNPRNTILQPNTSDDDLTSSTLNLSFLTDGFQFTGSNNDVNKLNENYIFLAIA